MSMKRSLMRSASKMNALRRSWTPMLSRNSKTSLPLRGTSCLLYMSWTVPSESIRVLSSSSQYYRSFSSAAAQTVDTPDDSQHQKVIPFLLADIGEGIAEVELLQWYVNVGDHVSQFDRICEVQSDKATVEITSRYDGIIQNLDGASGDMISVGSPLLHIAVASEQGESDTKESVSETLNNVDDETDRLHIPSLESKFDIAGDHNSSSPKVSSVKVLTTPAVRKLAMDYDLDLGNIVGTGPKGRILKADVKKLLKDGGILDEEDDDAPVSTTAHQPVHEAVAQDKVVEIKGYNRLMVKSMTASLEIPHMCYSDEINMNAILACRQELKPMAESQYGIRLSLLPFAIKAVSLAIKQYPVVNSTIYVQEYKLTFRASHNIGVAMDTPRGLAVPVVKECQNLSVMEIAMELERLKKLASEGSLAEADITDATFTLSNIGAIGGTYMSPIVSSPQVAIGAMGRIQRLPRFVDDSMQVEETNIMQISWGGDHRVIDGATMARFSNQWKDYMESPMTMVFALK